MTQTLNPIITTTPISRAQKTLTTTDLYLWVLDQQQILQEEIGTSIKTENVVDYVASQDGRETSKTGTTTDEKLERILTDSEPQQPDCLFRDIMVSISEFDSEWVALEQAMLVNRCSNGSILGIHVLSESSENKDKDMVPREDEFSERLRARGMNGKLLTVSGDVSKSLRHYSLLSDLLVLKLTYPPGGSVFDRLSSGIITLLQTSRRPVLFVKETPLVVSNILLLFDEREKSREALFISAYYAARYGCSLSVAITSKEGSNTLASTAFLTEYLSALDVHYESFVLDQETIEVELPDHISQKQFSTVIIGGYESGGLLDRIFASNVDKVLETSAVPVLVCQ